MEDLPYKSILAILAFWLVLVLVFIAVIYRLKMKRAGGASRGTGSLRLRPESHGDSKRVIQIFYIGNCDSDSESISTRTDDILNRVLERIEDQPPTYDEILSNGTSINREELSAVPVAVTLPQTCSSSRRPVDEVIRNPVQKTDNDFVVLVEHRTEAT